MPTGTTEWPTWHYSDPPDYHPPEDPDEATEALVEDGPPADAYVDDSDWYEWNSRGVA